MRFNLFRFRPLLVVLSGVALAGTVPLAGVGNFRKVNDGVYRGAQPTEEGFAGLAKLGIKTVIDLRTTDEHSQDWEQKMVTAHGMRYVSIPMRGMSTPTDAQVGKALSILNDPGAAPVFIHCHRGADRTGAVIACYRVGHDHWKNNQALKEARSDGMSWYQFELQRYVLRYRPLPTPTIAAAPPTPATGVKHDAAVAAAAAASVAVVP